MMDVVNVNRARLFLGSVLLVAVGCGATLAPDAGEATEIDAGASEPLSCLDCADPECEGKSCANFWNGCEAGPQVCQAGQCLREYFQCPEMPGVSCRSPRGTCVGAFHAFCDYPVLTTGSPCSTGDGGVGWCVESGVCATAEQCTDGLDNDGDYRSDCADPDCLGQSCDDGRSCTTNDVCQASGTCLGRTYACIPGECELSSACRGDGTCEVTIQTGSPCDGGTCSASGSCQ